MGGVVILIVIAVALITYSSLYVSSNADDHMGYS